MTQQPNERLLPCRTHSKLDDAVQRLRERDWPSLHPDIMLNVRAGDLRTVLDAIGNTRVPAVQDEGMVDFIGLAVQDALDWERTVQNAAKGRIAARAAIQAMSLYGGEDE